MADFETKYETYFRLAMDMLSRTESVDEVFRFIESIEGNDGDYRDSTLGKLAEVFVSQHKSDEALRFCCAIADSVERADSMVRVARKLWDETLTDSAKELLTRATVAAEGAEHPSDTAAVFLQIAGLLERWGEQGEATKLLGRAVKAVELKPQTFEAAKTLRGCARLLASWNRVQEAIEIAQLIDLPELRNAALEEVQGRGQWPVRPGVQLG